MKTCVLAALAALAATSAKADLTFCNDGPEDRQVAIAYSDAGVWTSEGWWKIPGGDCKVVVAGDLTRQRYYFNAPLNGEERGEHRFCVTAEAFTLPGADGDCAAMGAESRSFEHIDTGKTAKDFVHTLTADAAPAPVPETSADAPAADPAPADPAPADPAPAEPATPAGDPAAAASFAPGTHGEPFTVNALMQNCETAGEGTFCFFYAEGARWAVAQGGPSNPDALAQMAGLSVNTPLLVTGDMASFGDITAEAVVSAIQPGKPDEWAGLRDAVQGSWVSAEDAQNVLFIFGSEQYTSYAGETVDVSVLTFANACPGGDEIGPVFFTQTMGGDPMDALCYAVIDVTPDRMELSYVGRGNTLVYNRLEDGGQ